MRERTVTVAIPVRNGGERLAEVLEALARQTSAHELLICDSGSDDGSLELARAHGARVIEIPPQEFGHGRTRNLLMGEARTSHVALLTQDAQPAAVDWLERLLEGFALARDVGLVYGPYIPRADASFAVRTELARWFGSLSSDGRPRIDRLGAGELSLDAHALIGARGFFTDANACIARSTWARVPFREVAYAEDRVLALDALRAGFAKVYVPAAAVLHSHAYTGAQELRRCFDEWRALLEVYGWREPASPVAFARRLRGELGYARRELSAQGVPARERRTTLGTVARHNVLRSAGMLLGSRADKLPGALRRRISLERRAGFAPLGHEPAPTPTIHPVPPDDR